MSDLDFMQIDVDTAIELSIVQNGYEGELQITSVTPNAEKHYVLVILDIVGKELTRNIRNMIFFPKPDDDDEKKNNKLLRIKTFFEAFGIDGDARRDPMGWVGMSALAVLKITSDDTWGDQNEVQRFLQK